MGAGFLTFFQYIFWAVSRDNVAKYVFGWWVQGVLNPRSRSHHRACQWTSVTGGYHEPKCIDYDVYIYIYIYIYIQCMHKCGVFRFVFNYFRMCFLSVF